MWQKLVAWFTMLGASRAAAELARQGYLEEAKNLMLEKAKAEATIKELSRLTDRELNDIGIARGEIHSIAYGYSDNHRVA